VLCFKVELQRVRNNYDLYILLKAWRDNRHAGGDEFNAKLKEFYKSMRLRPSHIDIL